MAGTTASDKKNNTQQTDQKKKPTEALAWRMPGTEYANSQGQNQTAYSKFASNESENRESGTNVIPSVHGSQPLYANGSERMYTKFQESLEQTGDYNHPETQKKEMDYKKTLGIDQLREYNDAKSQDEPVESEQTAKSNSENPEPSPEFILQSGSNKFRTPKVYNNTDHYTVNFHQNQTDYDGSLITNELQFNAFMTRVLTESDVVLPKHKPENIYLVHGFRDTTIETLKNGGKITYTPGKDQNEEGKKGDQKDGGTLETGTGRENGTGIGNENGTATPKKSAEEVQKEYDAFPESVKKLIRTSEEGNSITPEEKLAVAQYIFDNLSVLEMIEYAEKVSKSTMSLADFKDSIQEYKNGKSKEEANKKTRETLREELSTADFKKLYELYKDYAYWVKLSGMRTPVGTASPGNVNIDLTTTGIMEEKRKILVKSLKIAGYKDIEAFKDKITAYEKAFEEGAFYTAIDQLKRYKHILFEEESKLESPAYLQQLLRQIKSTGAAQVYDAGERQKAGATTYRRNGEAFDVIVDYDELEAGQQKINKADSLVGTIPNDLVKEKQFDKSEFAALSDTESLKKFLKAYIREKQKSINTIEFEITQNHEVIYGMDLLYNTCKEEQKITDGSVLDQILTDKKSKVETFKIIKDLAILFGAIVLTIASAGTGTLALIALGGSFALSAYTVYETIETYKTEHAAYNVGALSDDPSLLWVVIAIAGAAVDAAVLGKALKASKPIAKAAGEFNTAKDLKALEESLLKIDGLDKKIRLNIQKQAEVQMQYDKVIKGFSEAKKLMNTIPPGLIQATELLTHMFFAVRKGILTFEKMLLELKTINLIEDLEKLSKEEISILEETFAKAKTISKDDKRAMDLEKALAEKDLAKVKELIEKEHIPVQEIDNKFPHEAIPKDGFVKDWTIKNGLIVGPKGDPMHAPTTPLNFIIDMQGNLKIGEKHAFLANNESVQAAGSIVIKGGKIRLIDNLSGHYKPTLEQALKYKEIFEKAGLKTEGTLQQIFKVKQNDAGEIIEYKLIKTIRW